VCDNGLVWQELFSRQYPRSELTASTLADWKRCFELEVQHLASDLRCFFTRRDHTEDVLGMPLDYTVNPIKK
jgi:hypothetical protein